MAIRLDENGFEDLREHIGHTIECVCYADQPDKGIYHQPWNVALECVDCGVVLLDFDNPEQHD